MTDSPGINVALGDVIRRHRERRGWTQQYLADKAKIAKSTLRNTEKGRVAAGYKLHEIAEALELKLSELYTEAEQGLASMFPDVGTFVTSMMAARGIDDAELARLMGVRVEDVRRLKIGNAGPLLWGAAAVALDVEPRLMESIAKGEKDNNDDDNGRSGEWLTQRS